VNRKLRRIGLGAAAAGAGALLGRSAWYRASAASLNGRVAVVTGGSRGLGLLVARGLLREGCRVAILARDAERLERARGMLAPDGEALAVACDVGDREQVTAALAVVEGRWGPVEILCNVAGVIDVGPVGSMTEDDYRRSLDIMLWGVIHPTLAVLPGMRRRRWGRIVNVTSIGGKVAVPRLLPYAVAKFGAVGLSEGLGAALRRDGVRVTTVVPGLMRTGSHLRARFRARRGWEYAWFAIAATVPLLSMDAERAAGRIVQAARRGQPELILTLPANLAVRLQGLAPGLTTDLLALADRMLPPRSSPEPPADGMDVERELGWRWLERLTALGRSAAGRFNQT
jgi:NAD(P)-dependent dehydrogenase (short-subunit alcohol dehydrogenase family)